MKTHLGENIYFVPVDLGVSERGMNGGYGHLYKDDKKLSEEIFRVGGLGGNYRDGYCELLRYTKRDTKKSSGGLWVLVDTKGKIVYKAKNRFNHFYHVGGIMVTHDSKWVNIKTGEEICNDSSSIQTSNLIFTHSYIDHKEVVYQINKHTGEVIIHK